MDISRERDQSVERLLRQALQTARHDGVTDSCLDAETLAAWVDGGLSGAALEMAQSHVADCARCQSLVGTLARANTVVPQAEPERAARPWLAWLVPLTAAAAAVAVWIAVPRDLSTPAAPAPRASAVQEQAAGTSTEQPSPLADTPQATIAGRLERATPPAAGKVAGDAPAPELRKETAQLEADSLQRRDASAARAAAPSAPPAEAARAPASANSADGDQKRLAETFRRPVGEAPRIEILSPDPSVRWRIAGSVVERSTNGGASWDAVPTGIAAVLTAAAAPSTMVCWVVGGGGVVLLSTDGRTWRRMPFPENTVLSSVQAADARIASVTTADGRTFSTSDGGMTWERR